MNHDQFLFLCACVLSVGAEDPAKLTMDLKGALVALKSEGFQAEFPVLVPPPAADAPAVAPVVP